jgi:hypothetical protein
MAIPSLESCPWSLLMVIPIVRAFCLGQSKVDLADLREGFPGTTAHGLLLAESGSDSIIGCPPGIRTPIACSRGRCPSR